MEENTQDGCCGNEKDDAAEIGFKPQIINFIRKELKRSILLTTVEKDSLIIAGLCCSIVLCILIIVSVYLSCRHKEQHAYVKIPDCDCDSVHECKQWTQFMKNINLRVTKWARSSDFRILSQPLVEVSEPELGCPVSKCTERPLVDFSDSSPSSPDNISTSKQANNGIARSDSGDSKQSNLLAMLHENGTVPQTMQTNKCE